MARPPGGVLHANKTGAVARVCGGRFLLAAFAGPVDASAAATGRTGGTLRKLSADQITKLAAQADKRWIIVLKNQHADLPARPDLAARRAQAVDSDQADIKNELSALRGRDVKAFHIVNAVSATISKAEAKRLEGDPAVRAVVPDLRRPLPLAANKDTSVANAGAAAQPSAAELQQICPPDPSVPLLEPEAPQVMNVEFQPGDTRPAAHQLGDAGPAALAGVAMRRAGRSRQRPSAGLWAHAARSPIARCRNTRGGAREAGSTGR